MKCVYYRRTKEQDKELGLFEGNSLDAGGATGLVEDDGSDDGVQGARPAPAPSSTNRSLSLPCGDFAATARAHTAVREVSGRAAALLLGGCSVG
jgi:hypothetical protein